MSPAIVQCAQHGAELVEGCRNCATARLVNDAADRDRLEERIRVLTRRLARVLRAATGTDRFHNGRTWRHRGVWSRRPGRTRR